VAEQLRFARALATRLPATRDLLAAGLIDGHPAWLIWDSISRLVDPANVLIASANEKHLNAFKELPDATGWDHPP